MDALQPFDFRIAGTTDPLVRALKNWLRKSEVQFTEAWDAVTGDKTSLTCDTVLSRTFEQGVGENWIGFGLTLGENQVNSLICMSHDDVYTLVASIVGNTDTAREPDQKLTSIEVSLCQMLLESLTTSLRSTFDNSDSLKVQLGEYEEVPHLTRLIATDELVLCMQIAVEVGETSIDLTWMLPRYTTQSLFDGDSYQRPTSNDPTTVVMHMPLDLVGILGQTSMEMESVAELNVGDIVVLNQKINEPVSVQVDDVELFQCWPGQIDGQQGLEIVNVV